MAIDLNRADPDILQNVADQVVIRRHTRGSAIGSVIFGLINSGIGFWSMGESALNLILGLIGLFLLAEGIFLLVTSNPKGLIADGVAFITVGMWNIVITIMNISQGGEGQAFFAVLGVIQIGWGIQSFKRFDRFSHTGKISVSPDLAGEIKILIEEIKKGNPKKSMDMIQFNAGSRIWKGRLAQGRAIMLTTTGDDIQIMPKSDFTIERTGKAMIGSTVYADISLKRRTMKGTISTEHMERFENWKNAQEEEEVLGEAYLKKDFGSGSM